MLGAFVRLPTQRTIHVVSMVCMVAVFAGYIWNGSSIWALAAIVLIAAIALSKPDDD